MYGCDWPGKRRETSERRSAGTGASMTSALPALDFRGRPFRTDLEGVDDPIREARGLCLPRPFAEVRVACTSSRLGSRAQPLDPVGTRSRQRPTREVGGAGAGGHDHAERQRELEQQIRIGLGEMQRHRPRVLVDRDRVRQVAALAREHRSAPDERDAEGGSGPRRMELPLERRSHVDGLDLLPFGVRGSSRSWNEYVRPPSWAPAGRWRDPGRPSLRAAPPHAGRPQGRRRRARAPARTGRGRLTAGSIESNSSPPSRARGAPAPVALAGRYRRDPEPARRRPARRIALARPRPSAPRGPPGRRARASRRACSAPEPLVGEGELRRSSFDGDLVHGDRRRVDPGDRGVGRVRNPHGVPVRQRRPPARCRPGYVCVTEFDPGRP